MATTRTPKYRVIDPNPSFERVVTGINASDAITWAALTAIGAPFGYFRGGHIKGPMTIMAMFTGFSAGFAYSVQSSFGRLIGERE